MPEYDLLVRGGQVVMPRIGLMRADVGVRGGQVAAVGHDLPTSADHVLDAGGLWVFPGLIDAHVHIGNHFPYRDDLASESRSAAFGGVTTFLTTLRRAQFSSPPRPYTEFFEEAIRGLEGAPSVDWAPTFTVSPDSPFDEIQACYEEHGVQSYKVFLAYKDREVDPGMGLDHLLRFLQLVAAMPHRPLVKVHAEDEEIVRAATEQAKAVGLEGLRAWNAARPNLAEELAIRQVCGLAKRTGVMIYIVHVSTREGAAVVAEELRRGAPVIAETCAHYLALTSDVGGVVGKINPPLREQADVDALWQAVEQGTITTIASDHVARPPEFKQGSIWDVSAAFPGMETLLPAVLTGFRTRSLPIERIAELCSLNVARTFGLFPRKGHLAPGADADMVLVDPEQRRVIRAADLHSIGRHTPYEGMQALGWPVATVLRGRVIVKDGELVAERCGQFVPCYPGVAGQ